MSMHLLRLLLALSLVALPACAQAQVSLRCQDGPSLTSVELGAEISETVPSATIAVFASVQNNSSAPIDGHVLAVEVQRQSDGAIVDRFVAPQKVTVFGMSLGKVNFEWTAPPGLTSGMYTIIATVAPADAARAQAFAHIGFPTARLPIIVSDGTDETLAITSVRVNGASYETWTVAPASEGSVSAVVTAANSQSGPYRGVMEWRLFARGASLEDAPLDTRSSPVGIHAGTSQDISYVLPSEGEAAYYIEGILKDASGSSYIDVLVDRGGGAFPWSACITAAKSESGRTFPAIFVGVLAIILALGVALKARYKWDFLPRA